MARKNVARVDAHSIWWRQKWTNDAYAILATEESGMAAIPMQDRSSTTIYGKTPQGTFTDVVTSLDAPGALPSFDLNIYEQWGKVHPLLKLAAYPFEVILFLQRLRFSAPNNMDVRVLAKQLDLLECRIAGGERGAAPNQTGEGGATPASISLEVLDSLTVQLDASLSRVTTTEAEDILSVDVVNEAIDPSTGFTGPGKVIYFGAGSTASPANVLVSLDGGSTVASMVAPYAINAGITAIAHYPISETSMRIVVGHESEASTAPAIATFDVSFGTEDTEGSVTEVSVPGLAVADAIQDILWLTYNRMYIAAENQIFLSADAGATIETNSLADPGQQITAFAADKEGNVWAVGASNTILREDANNRGTFQTKSGPSGGAGFTAVAVADDGVIFVGNGTKVYSSANEGQTWVERMNAGATAVINDIILVDGSSEVVYVAYTLSSVGYLVRSIDGGLSWSTVTGIGSLGYQAMAPTVDPNKVLLVGDVVTATGYIEILS